MNQTKIIEEIRENLDGILKLDSSLALSLWQIFLELHPADIADFLTEIESEATRELFLRMPRQLQLDVFKELSDYMKNLCISFLSESDKIDFLRSLSVDELADFFDEVSDEDLKKYLSLLHSRDREKIISLLKFHPESAGGIMDTEVLTLLNDFTVEKSLKLIQRVRPRQDIHHHIYVTNKKNQLIGHIHLEDLVLRQPQDRISSFLRKNELIAHADEDQEVIAKQMVHYKLTTIPVVGDDNYFLGIIPSETLVDVLVEESLEDVQKMAALTPIKGTYFETPLTQIISQRAYILIGLLLAESFSGTILRAYEDTLKGLLMFFIPMLLSTGGNTSSQTSAIAIQGMTSGEIHQGTMRRFLKRELFAAGLLALILGFIGFFRVYWVYQTFWESLAVSLSLGMVVLFSVMLGSCIPLFLKQLRIDPAFSAGPFLATIMDILGILMYCYITKLILS